MSLRPGTKVRVIDDKHIAGGDAGKVTTIQERIDWVDRESYRLTGCAGHYDPKWFTVIGQEGNDTVLTNLREAVIAARRAGHKVKCEVTMTAPQTIEL